MQRKFICNLGDVNPIDHGGIFLYVDAGEHYAPELGILELPCEDETRGKYSVYRIVLEKCTYENGILSDNHFHRDYPAWFADSIVGVCSSCGIDTDELILGLCSDDPRERAQSYLALVGYHGAFEFDNYPLEISKTEARSRYRREMKSVS